MNLAESILKSNEKMIFFTYTLYNKIIACILISQIIVTCYKNKIFTLSKHKILDLNCLENVLQSRRTTLRQNSQLTVVSLIFIFRRVENDFSWRCIVAQMDLEDNLLARPISADDGVIARACEQEQLIAKRSQLNSRNFVRNGIKK